MDKLRALAWKQPFGSLMLHDKIETRMYPTSIRGQVLIYTSVVPYTERDVHDICGDFDISHRVLLQSHGDPTAKLNGYAIGVGNLVDVRRMAKADVELCYVRYHSDRWCWVFEDVKRIEPFEYKIYSHKRGKIVSAGGQGWNFVPESLVNKIIYTDASKIQP